MKFHKKEHDDLKSFLQANRPKAPPPPENEFQILERKLFVSKQRHWTFIVPFATGIASIVFAAFFIYPLSSIENQKASDLEASLVSQTIEESLELGFMESEDMSDVFELVSLVE